MTITLQAVNELIQSLESAGELSIKERKYLDIMRWAVGVAGERDAALNAERVWEKTMMEACGEDGPASVASEIRALQVLRDTAMQALKSQVEQLAAENAALKNVFGPGDSVLNFLTIALRHTTYDQIDLDDVTLAFKMSLPETPATDRIVAEAEARGVEKFAAEQRGVAERLQKRGVATASVPFCLDSAEEAEYFAKQLREGADKC
ncbi:TPA: hypothetical protein ACTYR0_003398 [Klebsiella michiganensis]